MEVPVPDTSLFSLPYGQLPEPPNRPRLTPPDLSETYTPRMPDAAHGGVAGLGPPPASVDAPNYRELIVREAARHGYSPEFALRMVDAESTFNPMARNASTGAMGLMQLLPKTAAMLGVTNRAAPDQVVPAGFRYLAQLQDQFKDQARIADVSPQELALAAYNWGEGNLSRMLKTGYNFSKLPAETKNYLNYIQQNIPKDSIPVPKKKKK